MSLTRIFIARHGETEYNRTQRIQGRGINESLNRSGRQQAHDIGQLLQDTGINHVFSSSLHRSVETAEIVAGMLNLPVESYTELDEMNFGIIEGRPIDEIQADIKKLHDAWRNGDTAFALKHGESPDAVLKRALLCMDALLEKYRGQTLLFILHGRLIRILLAHWLGYGISKMYHISHQNGALYQLNYDGASFESIFLNKSDHLTKEPADKNS